MNLLKNLNISAKKILQNDLLADIKGGDQLPPDCGGYSAWWCTIEWWGCCSMEGWGCGNSASDAQHQLEQIYPDADSIAWDKMDEPEFREVFGDCVQAFIDQCGERIPKEKLDEIIMF